ncbi:MAG TPA: hypothetical protein VN426_08185 [Syntrophomonadaceae bacterium]|nr:hypothetical protein [Syntrophomonadaceae bacterium]
MKYTYGFVRGKGIKQADLCMAEINKALQENTGTQMPLLFYQQINQ